MGRLFSCTFKEDEKKHLCRVMDFERITAYQLENYFTQVTLIHMFKMTKFVTTPVGVYIDEKNSIHVV